MSVRTTSLVWLDTVRKVITRGRNVSPRGQDTKEILGNQTRINMSEPVVTLQERKINHAFLYGEAWWILSGSNRVSDITPYLKNIAKFSDNGISFRGAYGPQVTEQLDYVAESLMTDIDSRQAVLSIWRQNPRSSKDIPCTLSMQWFIRDNKLHCSTTMRSSDLFLGWIYDVFNFSCVSMYIAIVLRGKYPALELGELILTAGSQHVYERDIPKIDNCFENIRVSDFDYSLFDLNNYTHPEEFITELKRRADNARK